MKLFNYDVNGNVFEIKPDNQMLDRVIMKNNEIKPFKQRR